MAKEVRINQRIRAREVRVIGESGEQLGIMPLGEALRIASERDLDLVEVAPNVVPPVCRVLDYGKFKYDQAKKERQTRKRQKLVELRQVRLRPKIGEHDFEAKVRLVTKLLERGSKVKVFVLFRGREISYPQRGKDLLDRVVKRLEGIAIVERPPALEGRNINIIVSSSKQSKKEKV